MMRKTLFVLALFALSSGALAEDSAPADFDCESDPSCVLQVKAWDALAAEQHEVAVNFAAACVQLNEDAARKQQSSLSKLPDDGGYSGNGSLNHAGTCSYIKGEALKRMGKNAEALAAFKTIVEEFSYSQAWDPRGWFWTVADAASQSITEIESEQSDIDF